MKKRNFKLLCMILAIFMLSSTVMPVLAVEEIAAVESVADEHDHDGICADCDSGSEIAYAAAANECHWGHWFTTTEYRQGGACYASYNARNGTNNQCYIVIYKVVTCDYCGQQLSHEEYSRTYGACLWASTNH